MDRSIILTSEQIQHKTRRIAFQILETNCDEKEIVIAGITGNGFLFARKLIHELSQISDTKIIECEVFIDKRNPLHPVSTSLKPESYINSSLVLVDDVLNSGTTLIYGIKHFLQVPLKKFKTAVLINRNHKKYPVKADFKGISLSTSMQEHVNVNFDKSSSIATLE